MTSTIGSQIVEFIENYIICRFGVPNQLIMDNGKNFKNKDVKWICDKYKIKQSFSTPYYPQGNRQAEATTNTIRNILAKIVNDSHRDWHMQLPKALWA